MVKNSQKPQATLIPDTAEENEDWSWLTVNFDVSSLEDNWDSASNSEHAKSLKNQTKLVSKKRRKKPTTVFKSKRIKRTRQKTNLKKTESHIDLDDCFPVGYKTHLRQELLNHPRKTQSDSALEDNTSSDSPEEDSYAHPRDQKY